MTCRACVCVREREIEIERVINVGEICGKKRQITVYITVSVCRYVNRTVRK